MVVTLSQLPVFVGGTHSRLLLFSGRGDNSGMTTVSCILFAWNLSQVVLYPLLVFRPAAGIAGVSLVLLE